MAKRSKKKAKKSGVKWVTIKTTTDQVKKYKEWKRKNG